MIRLLFILTLLSTLLFSAQSMRPATYEGIQESTKLMEAKHYDQALKILEDLISDTSKNRRYDQAFLQNALGYFWIQKENYPKAILSYEKALSYKSLPKAMNASITLTLAQLSLQQENFLTSLKLLQDWHKEQKATAFSSKLMMIVFVSLGNKEEGLLWCDQSLKLSKEPSLSLYQTKLSLELQLSKELEAIQTLEIILQKFDPKLIYFKQLAFLYAKYHKDKESVALLESAYQMDLLTQKEDLIQLCGLLHQQGSALKASQIMERLIWDYPNDEKLHTYLAAMHIETKEMEKALELLEHQYKQFHHEETALKLAQLFAQNSNWDKTLAYASMLSQPKAKFLQAIALAQTHKPIEAIELFNKLLKNKEMHKDAQMWLNHLKQ